MKSQRGQKRKAGADTTATAGGPREKKSKKNWKGQLHKGKSGFVHEIESGDTGIWASCGMGKEALAVVELRRMLEEHADQEYGQDGAKGAEKEAQDSQTVEDEIAEELSQLRDPKTARFRSVKIDGPCLVFFKTSPPVDPVAFVTSLCRRMAADPSQAPPLLARFVQRLTPITLFGKANLKAINQLADEVLPPHFTPDPEQEVGLKYAIRVSIRNSGPIKRGEIIDQVAAKVPSIHKVDLSNYDKLILVDVHKNVCGMSVVDRQYDELKRFNITEICKPPAAEE